MNIEDTVTEETLPVNSKAMINRLKDLMEERQTNCLSVMRDDIRVQKVLWLLNSQVFGQTATIDMCAEWKKFDTEKMYLDYVNNFLTLEAFAEHYNITEKKALEIIKAGKLINGNYEDCEPDDYDDGMTDAEADADTLRMAGYIDDSERFI